MSVSDQITYKQKFLSNNAPMSANWYLHNLWNNRHIIMISIVVMTILSLGYVLISQSRQASTVIITKNKYLDMGYLRTEIKPYLYELNNENTISIKEIDSKKALIDFIKLFNSPDNKKKFITDNIIRTNSIDKYSLEHKIKAVKIKGDDKYLLTFEVYNPGASNILLGDYIKYTTKNVIKNIKSSMNTNILEVREKLYIDLYKNLMIKDIINNAYYNNYVLYKSFFDSELLNVNSLSFSLNNSNYEKYLFYNKLTKGGVLNVIQSNIDYSKRLLKLIDSLNKLDNFTFVPFSSLGKITVDNKVIITAQVLTILISAILGFLFGVIVVSYKLRKKH